MNTCIKCKIYSWDMITKYDLCYYCYMGYKSEMSYSKSEMSYSKSEIIKNL